MNSPNTLRLEIEALERALLDIIGIIERAWQELDALESHPTNGVRRPLTIHAENGAVYQLHKVDEGWEATK